MRMLLTYLHAAEKLDVSVKTIQRGVKAGEIPTEQAPGTRGSHGRRVPSWFIDKLAAKKRGWRKSS